MDAVVSGFLNEMDHQSRVRLDGVDTEKIWQQALDMSPSPTLQLESFGVIAEVKFSAPSVGVLRDTKDPISAAVQQAITYEAGGASAISVLTEPSRFLGSLQHLKAVASAVDIPVMRKDFLIDPIQVVEARAHGAGGVLIIVRMVDDATLDTMVEQAQELGMFVLLEAFDAIDIGRAERYGDTLIGLNCRDLQSLAVEPQRFQSLASAFGSAQWRVAESGLNTAEDIRGVAGLGYNLVLVGTALMQSDNPGTLLKDMIQAGRERA